jgi:hypothetical protein
MLLDDITPPPPDEYPAFMGTYIEHVAGQTIGPMLERQARDMTALLRGLDETEALKLHPPYTWTVKQAVGHVTDQERVFEYRLLRFARGDQTPLSGFDENVYAQTSNVNSLKVEDVLEEFLAVRGATLALLKNLPSNVQGQGGPVNGVHTSVRALAYVIAGHAEHHLVILKKRLGRT